MKEIQLKCTHLKIQLSNEDYDYYNQWTWRLKKGYAHNKHKGMLHRLITNAQPGEIVDHIDRNKLNNQRSNLRIVDTYISARNRGKRPGTTSQYIGVFKNPSGTWRVYCSVNGKGYSLGTYTDEEVAAYAYNKFAQSIPHKVLNPMKQSVEQLESLLTSTKVKASPPARYQSKVKGISWKKRDQRWRVMVTVNKKRYHLGFFKNEQDAIDCLNKFNKLSIADKIKYIGDRPTRRPRSTERGIYYRRDRERWIVRITRNGKRYRCGTFKIEEAAKKRRDMVEAMEYDAFIKWHFKQNTPASKQSRYPGISWDELKQLWRFRKYIDGKRIDFGYFKSEKDAIDKYNTIIK